MVQIKLFLILKKYLHVLLITKTIFVVAYLMVLVEKRCLPNGFSREKQLMFLRIYLKEWKMLRQKSVHCLILYNQI